MTRGPDNPRTFTASLVALLFHWFGFFLKDKNSFLNGRIKPLLIVSGGILSFVFCYLNTGGVVFALDYYGTNILYFVLSALAGIVYVVTLTTYTRPNKILSYVRTNTLIVLGLHRPLDRILNEHFHLLSYIHIPSIPATSINLLNSIITILNQTLLTGLLLVMELLIISLLIPVFNKKLYRFLG